MAAVLACVVGCQSSPRDTGDDGPNKAGADVPQGTNFGTPPVVAPQPKVDHINLQTAPTALNWDGKPGADGIEARVFLFQVKQPKPVALERGTLELLVYEGRVEPNNLSTTKPEYVWRYPMQRLVAHRGKTAVGVGYLFRLDWTGVAPRSEIVTVSARIPNPDGNSLYAMPIMVTVLSGGEATSKPSNNPASDSTGG